MKNRLFIQFSALFLMVLTIGTSVYLPIIEHECNFSKQKSYHFFSLEHECLNDTCLDDKQLSKEQQISKMPCCSVKTTFVQNDEPVILSAKISIVQAAIITQVFKLVLEPFKIKEVKPFVHKEHQKLYGYQYRIALQSFLC